MTKSDKEWQRAIIQMNTNESKSKIEWFYVSKVTNKTNVKGQSTFWIILFNFLCNILTTIRTNRSQMFFEIGVLKVSNIHRKTPVLKSLFSKVASLEAYKFIKKRLQNRCFPVNIANFLRKFYLKNTTFGCFCTWNSPGIWLNINREIGGTYFQYNTLCLYYAFFHFLAIS